MGFDGIKNKSASMGKKPMSAFLKVNKYENPQTVLDLISHICTSGMDLSVSDEFTPYHDKCSQLEEDYSEINTREAENPFVNASISDLTENCAAPYARMPAYLDYSGFSDAINVAVGGGYSSGKSSFLNNITGIGAVLPTGIEPVSMINTYISFSDKISKLIVSGKNCKGHVVKLNREVLDCIQHSSKSKVYVSSVLEELYIKVPVSKEREYLKGLVFIDTPGYNNSDNPNKENGKTDSDTASDAWKNSDALFWCIDAEAGTISQRDIEELDKQIGDKDNYPFVIVFNKMDKKPNDEIVKILKSAEKVCKSKLKIQPIDMIGFSSIGKSAIYSLKTKQKATTKCGVMKVLASIIYKMKDGFSNTRSVSFWTNWLADCFDQEIKTCDGVLASLENKRKKLAKKKADAFSKKTNSKNVTLIDDCFPHIKEVLIDSYDEILTSRDGLIDLFNRAMKGWSKALDREDQWAEKTGFFSDASNLQRQSNNAVKEYNRVMTAAEKNCDEFQFWNTESRKEDLDLIRQAYEYYDSADEDVQDSLKEDYDNTVASKETISIYKSFLQKKKQEIVHVFTTCCENAIKKNEKRLRALLNIKEEEETDVFSAIANDNMNRFLDCFSNGVDLTKCNSQGYSPLTYVAKNSNNAMMRFLIDHEVDLSLKDKNGYNALETAAIYHCQDICELLINADKGLLMESQSLTKLAANDRFENWISNF
ncbi:dynamin family protein [uncultured Prevotella sp.]|uniref:dynamin family protein n=1 Tax=uncultured Prevotella sp. TaxID=159272 RepID=UPI00259582ED|nr:dynamin family protein [uncultured Prevotella sp.]